MTQRISMCEFCRHAKEAGACNAFPNGIPSDFMSGRTYHTSPIKGDHGIQFELDGDSARRFADVEDILATQNQAIATG